MTAKLYGFDRSLLHDTTERDPFVIDMVRADEYLKLEAQVAALQEQVRALATECKAVYDHALEEGYQFYPGGIEYTDAALREIRADGAMACGVHLREWYDYQVEERAEEFAAAIRTGEQP